MATYGHCVMKVNNFVLGKKYINILEAYAMKHVVPSVVSNLIQ